jgi:hypothetical protein
MNYKTTKNNIKQSQNSFLWLLLAGYLCSHGSVSAKN